jgi:capsid protein
MTAFEAIDPVKEMEGDILAVRSGRMSPQDFIEMWGRDHRVVMREFADFYAAADESNLVFDIDARHRTRGGQAVIAGSPDPASAAAPAPTAQDD